MKNGNWVSLFVMSTRVATLAAKFGITIVIARFLGLESLGVYGMIVGAVAIVPVMASFGFAQSLARDASHESLDVTVVKLSRYGSIVFSVYLPLLFVGGCVDVVKNAPFWSLLVVIIFFEHVNNDAFNLLIATGRPVLANILVFVRSSLWIYAYTAFVFFEKESTSFATLLQFWTVGLLITTVCSGYHLRKWPWEKVCLNILEAYSWGREYLKGSKYLYISEIASNASFYIDRYLIGAFLGVAEAGVYTFFSSVGMALYNLVSSGVMQVARPGLVSSHVKKDYKRFDALFLSCFRRSVAASLILVCLAIAAFPWFAPYVKQAELQSQYGSFAFLLVGVLVRIVADLEGYKLYTARMDLLFMRSTLLCLLVAFFSNISLVLKFQLSGAIASTWIAYFVTYIYRYRTFRNVSR